jgi:phage-related protein (TIGR01555 family)
VHETLRDYDVSWGSISNLLEESSIGVMKLQGLFKMLASKDQSIAQARMQVMAQSKSMVHTLFLDADGNESFDRTEVSFASLPQLMQQINLRTSGAAGLPAAKLFGMEPAGMNATGESDIRNFYDDAAEYRSRAALKLQRLMSWALGKEIKLEWPALWEMTDKESAEARLINAQADKIWSVDIGALTAEDIGVARAKDGSFGIDVDPNTIAADIAKQAAKEQADQERAQAEQAEKLQGAAPGTPAQGNNAPPAPPAPGV